MSDLFLANYQLGSKVKQVEKDFPDKRGRNFNEVFRKTGVRVRYEISGTEDVLTLAISVVAPILGEIKTEDIECLILITQSPTSLIPATSFYLHEKLGLSKNCATFDLAHGCSGFVYGLLLGHSLIKAGRVRSFLLVTSETYSKYIREEDTTTRPIFSDGASAMFFSLTNLPEILASYFYTDGSGAGDLCLVREENISDNLNMNGIKVFTFTMNHVPMAIHALLKEANLNLHEIDCFVFHQASEIVLKSLQEKLEIPDDKMFKCLENFGNTVSSSIPIALIEAGKTGKILKGNKVLVVGFGVGLSVCGAVVIF